MSLPDRYETLLRSTRVWLIHSYDIADARSADGLHCSPTKFVLSLAKEVYLVY